MYELAFAICLLASGAASLYLLRTSLRAARFGAVYFALGSGLGLFGVILFCGGVLETSGPLVLLAIVVYVTVLTQWSAVIRCTFFRSLLAALRSDVPLEHALQSSLCRIHPFDRGRINRALTALQQGGSPREVLDAWQLPSGLRLAVAAQLGCDDAATEARVNDMLRREQRMTDARMIRGGHWLYVALPALSLAVVGAMFRLFISFVLDEVASELPHQAPASWTLGFYLTDTFRSIMDAALWCAAAFSAGAAIIGMLQLSGLATFAPFGPPRKAWSIRVLPLVATAIEHRAPLTDYLEKIEAWRPSPAASRLLLAIRDAEANGHSWVEALKQNNYITPADARLLDSSMPVGNTPWAIDTVCERLLQRWSGRLEFENSVIFSAILLLIAVVLAQLPISLFVWMSHAIYYS